MRAVRTRAVAGGKGLNVARNVRRLGRPVRVVGFLGGSPREFIQRWCDRAGIETAWTVIEGETRTCVIITDPDGEGQTVVNEPGPCLGAEDVERLMATLHASVTAGDLLCISGSAPPGVPDMTYRRIVREMGEREVRVLVDATGGALRCALEGGPWAVTPNEEELRAALGGVGTPAEMARGLAARVPVTIVTLGSAGCLLAAEGRLERVRPPSVREVNAVGSGDAFAAGFLVGIQRGNEPLEAVRLGAACGASNATQLDPGIASEAEVASLLRQTVVEPV